MQQHIQPPRSPRPANAGGATHHPRPPRYRLRQAAAFVAGAAVLLLVQKLAESSRRLGASVGVSHRLTTQKSCSLLLAGSSEYCKPGFPRVVCVVSQI